MSNVGIAIGVIFGLILLIWISAEFKRAKHKILAIFLVAILLFFYFSTSFVFKDKKVDFKSIQGIADTVQIYFSWLGASLTSARTFTANVINGNAGNASVQTKIK